MEYRIFTTNELKDILNKHKEWLDDSSKGQKANLSSADLRFANLSSADLRFANLSSANLLIFQFQKHTAYYTKDGSLRIGCICLPITEWADTFNNIGTNQGYSFEQIQLYGQFITMCLNNFKQETK